MLSHITVMGRLTRDPEQRQVGEVPVCNFSIACDRDYKNAGGEKESDFIDVVAWRKTAETVSKYFTKGRMAVVEGRLQIRDWTDKECGKRRSAEIVADGSTLAISSPRAGMPPLVAEQVTPVRRRTTLCPSSRTGTASCRSDLARGR